MLLVEGKGSPRGNYLLDLKRAVPSTLPVIPRPGTASDGRREAERVVTTQRLAQAISPALLHAVTIGGRPFILKELQPMTDRLDLAPWDGRIERLDINGRSAWGQ